MSSGLLCFFVVPLWPCAHLHVFYNTVVNLEPLLLAPERRLAVRLSQPLPVEAATRGSIGTPLTQGMGMPEMPALSSEQLAAVAIPATAAQIVLPSAQVSMPLTGWSEEGWIGENFPVVRLLGATSLSPQREMEAPVVEQAGEGVPVTSSDAGVAGRSPTLASSVSPIAVEAVAIEARRLMESAPIGAMTRCPSLRGHRVAPASS